MHPISARFCEESSWSKVQVPFSSLLHHRVFLRLCSVESVHVVRSDRHLLWMNAFIDHHTLSSSHIVRLPNFGSYSINPLVVSFGIGDTED